MGLITGTCLIDENTFRCKAFSFNVYLVILPHVNHYSLFFFFFSFHLAEKTALISGCKKDMRKSSSPSLSNCNSVLANKIFGIPLDELQQGGHPDNEVPFIVRHVVDYIEEHGIYFLTLRASLCFNKHNPFLTSDFFFFLSIQHPKYSEKNSRNSFQHFSVSFT